MLGCRRVGRAPVVVRRWPLLRSRLRCVESQPPRRLRFQCGTDQWRRWRERGCPRTIPSTSQTRSCGPCRRTSPQTTSWLPPLEHLRWPCCGALGRGGWPKSGLGPRTQCVRALRRSLFGSARSRSAGCRASRAIPSAPRACRAPRARLRGEGAWRCGCGRLRRGWTHSPARQTLCLPARGPARER